MHTELTITGMTCHHCELSVQEEVGALEGVSAVVADHNAGTARVESAGPIDAAALRAAVEEAGYALTAIH